MNPRVSIQPLAVAAVLLVLGPPGTAAQQADSADADSTRADSVRTAGGGGYYTEAQAERGEQAFTENCSYCHSESQFSGSSFMQSWSGASVGDLFGLISSTMPRDGPGMLRPQTYTDIIAYILQLNDLPAGQTELPADPQALDGIAIEAPSEESSGER